MTIARVVGYPIIAFGIKQHTGEMNRLGATNAVVCIHILLFICTLYITHFFVHDPQTSAATVSTSLAPIQLRRRREPSPSLALIIPHSRSSRNFNYFHYCGNYQRDNYLRK